MAYIRGMLFEMGILYFEQTDLFGFGEILGCDWE